MSVGTLQVHGQLSKYGFKSRLQGLWRDTHSIDPLPNQQRSSPKRKRQSQDNSCTAFKDANAAAAIDREDVQGQVSDFVDTKQAAAFAVCNSYMDLFLPNHPYPVRCVQPFSKNFAVSLCIHRHKHRENVADA